jgi:hypothetical protein
MSAVMIGPRIDLVKKIHSRTVASLSHIAGRRHLHRACLEIRLSSALKTGASTTAGD